MSEPAILTCAVVGGMVTGNPNQPRTRDEVIASSIDAAAAGASVLHIHARTPAGEISQSPEDFEAIKLEIRAEVDDIVLNFTTGGRLGMAPEVRRRSMEAEPELASLNSGSINFGAGDDVFLNPKPLIADFAAEMDRRGIVREYECFDIGMAVAAGSLAESAPHAPGIMHLVLGVIGGAPPSVDAITMFARIVPDGVPWMVTAVGRHNFPMMAVTLALGGHVRTGLEDVVYTGPHRYADSNAELVTRAKSLCDAVGRPVATPAQTREILGIGRTVEAAAA
ncbi:MAG: beta-keto acid cleavage family enzyme [Solirubrobacteraceae bacterium]